VFFNLFFETEPYAAILVAHRTCECSHEFVLGVFTRQGLKFEAKDRERGGSSWEGAATTNRKCILYALRALKRPLAAANVVYA